MARMTVPTRDAKTMTPDDWRALAFEVQQTFSPAAPLAETDLFAGRGEQIQRVIEAVAERGKHVILFGERGVGKTSLAKIIEKLFPPTNRHIFSIREQADPSDDFDSIWRKVFKDIWVNVQREDGAEVQRRLDHLYDTRIAPDDVRRELEAVFKATEIPLIIIDEIDKIRDKNSIALLSNTIKHLSDYSVGATVILVGVADDVNDLVHEHESIQRCLEQILMPRMSLGERQDILRKALPKLGMNISQDALSKIVHLSRGLPSYVHSLGQSAALAAIERRSLSINEADVDAAITRVLRRSEESVQEAYARAVHSNRKDTLHKEVLLACALAETDDRGSFTPSAVCGPLTAILRRDKEAEISAFQQHLQKFISEDRGKILVQRGRERSYRYRFADPMMQPYIIMKGIEQELVSPTALEAISFPAQQKLSI